MQHMHEIRALCTRAPSEVTAPTDRQKEVLDTECREFGPRQQVRLQPQCEYSTMISMRKHLASAGSGKKERLEGASTWQAPYNKRIAGN